MTQLDTHKIRIGSHKNGVLGENKSTPRVEASLSATPLLAVQQQPRVQVFTGQRGTLAGFRTS